MLTGGDGAFSWGARERLPGDKRKGRLTKVNLVPTHILVKQNKIERSQWPFGRKKPWHFLDPENEG